MTSRYHSTSNNSRYRVPGTRKSYTYDSKSNDTILNDLERSITDFKVTSLFDAEYIRNATKYSYNALIRHTQSCHFEWPWPWFGKIVNATKYCTISVTAELLVFTASHWSFKHLQQQCSDLQGGFLEAFLPILTTQNVTPQ